MNNVTINAATNNNANFWNPYVFQTVISADFNDPDTVHFYLSNTLTWNNKWWDYFIAECETFYFKWGDQSLIVGPKIVYYYDWAEYHSTQQLMCHVWGDVYRLNGFAEDIEWQSGENWKDSQNKYHDSLDKAIKKLEQKDKATIISQNIQAWNVLQIKNAHSTWDDIWYVYKGNTPWLDVDNEVIWSQWKMARMHDILNWDDGYVGVFSALYASLLNAGVQLTDNNWVYVSLLNTILSFCHTLAVGIPLVAMVVVFFMRIWVIWMAIILSPVIILLKAFKFEESLTKMVDVFKYLSVKNLIGIIFSPAVICFAVSISTVLVRIISTVNAQNIMTQKTSILKWLVKIDLAWMSVDIWKLICSVIWVAISWFLIWSAVKASELWKSKMVTWLESLAKSALWSVPIIPVPNKDGWTSYMWVNTVFGWNGQDGIISKFSSKLKSKYEWQNNEAVEAFFKSKSELEKESKENQLSKYTEWLTNLTIPQITDNWLNQEIFVWEDKDNRIPITFTSLENSARASVIESINSLTNEDKRKAFGSKVPKITVWNDIYNFDTIKNKYEKQNNSSST